MLGERDPSLGQQLQGPACAAVGRVGAGGCPPAAPPSCPSACVPRRGRGSLLSATCKLPSTKRRLGRYTVDPPAATLMAMSSSLIPASTAKRICARLSLRAACFPTQANRKLQAA